MKKFLVITLLSLSSFGFAALPDTQAINAQAVGQVSIVQQVVPGEDVYAKVLKVGFEAMLKALPAMLDRMLQDAPTTDEKKIEMKALVMQKMSSGEYFNLMVNIYKTHFTEDDIREYEVFQVSAFGKKLFDKYPLIMQDSMEAAAKFMQQAVSTITPSVTEVPVVEEPATPVVGEVVALGVEELGTSDESACSSCDLPVQTDYSSNPESIEPAPENTNS